MEMKDRLKAFRKYLGLTQNDVADRLHIRQTHVSAMENGTKNITDRTISDICREFSISEEWLRTGSGNMRIPIEDEAAAAVSDLVEKSNPLYDIIKGIMVAYQKLDDPSREVIDQFILDAVSQRGRPQKAPEPAAPDLSDLSIDEKVELYRQELEREKKVAGESQALQENA